MPAYLDYWSVKFRYANIADIMPLKRYQQIRRYLHFVDNNLDDGDKYFIVLYVQLYSCKREQI